MLVSNKKPNSGAAKDAFHEISISRQFNLDSTDLECSFTFLCCPVLAPISPILASLFFLFIKDYTQPLTFVFQKERLGPFAKLISPIERIRWLFLLFLHLLCSWNSCCSGRCDQWPRFYLLVKAESGTAIRDIRILISNQIETLIAYGLFQWTEIYGSVSYLNWYLIHPTIYNISYIQVLGSFAVSTVSSAFTSCSSQWEEDAIWSLSSQEMAAFKKSEFCTVLSVQLLYCTS